jgi:hypothetical protein
MGSEGEEAGVNGKGNWGFRRFGNSSAKHARRFCTNSQEPRSSRIIFIREF